MKFHCGEGPTTKEDVNCLESLFLFLSLNGLVGLDPRNPGCSTQLSSEKQKDFRGKIRIYFTATLAPVSSN